MRNNFRAKVGMLVAGEIIDALCCPGPTSVPQPAPGKTHDISELIIEHARFGITRRLCLHAESRNGVPAEGNIEMSRLAHNNPGTGIIWTALPPRRFHGEAVDQIMERAAKHGVGAFALFFPSGTSITLSCGQ